MTGREITAATMNTTCSISRAEMANARAFPVAGGCSVSVMVITRIAKPTAAAATRPTDVSVLGRISKQNGMEQRRPIAMHMACPSISLLGCAVSCSAVAKTMNALAPSATTTAPFVSTPK